MSYYFAKTMNLPFDEARAHVEEELKKQGFGIVSEIDMHQKFKEKLGKDFRRYKILGACSPAHAYSAIQAEEHIGLMLPCNIVMQEKEKGRVEISVIDPIASMQAVTNEELSGTALEIRTRLQEFIRLL